MGELVLFPDVRDPWEKKNQELIWLRTKGLELYCDPLQPIDEAEVACLKQQIKKYGFIQPIIVDENNEVLTGQNDLEAARQLNKRLILACRAPRMTQAKKINFLKWHFYKVGDDHD